MKASIEKINVVNNKNTVAFIDVLIEGTIIIKGFKIMDGQNGRFLAAPATKGKDDKWYASVWFKTKEQNEAFGKHILKLAEAKINETGSSEQPAGPEDIAWEE